MTDDFDLSLRNRLEAVANAVPVDERRSLVEVRAERVNLGLTGRRLAPTGLMAIAAIAATGALIAGVLQVGPFAPAATDTTPSGSARIDGSPRPAAPSPDDGPQVGSDSEGPYSVEIRSGRRVYRESEAIDINAVFTYSGDQPASVRDDAFFPLTFGIREPVHGLTIIALQPVLAILRPGCRSLVLQPGERYESKFRISSFSPKPQTEEQQAFLADPELHLPPGTWHFVVESSVMGEPPCPIASDATADPTAIQSEDARMSAEIEIVVLPAPAATDPPPTASPRADPVASPGPVNDVGGVETIKDDGTFKVRLASRKARWLAGEPIDIEASATYIGPDDEVVAGHSSTFMTFDIEQLDGELVTGGGAGDLCTHTTFWRDRPHDVPFDKGPTYDTSDPNAAWYQAFGASNSFKLTAGTWRIGAYLEVFVPDCGDERHKFRTDIVIEVVNPVAVGGSGDPDQGGGSDWAVDVLNEYAAQHPESFGALWIDRPLLGPARVASSWTKDIEQHRAWMQEHIGFREPFAIYDAEFTEVSLGTARDQIHGDLDWLATVPAAVQSFGVNEVRNRVELDVSSAPADAVSRIRNHYAEKFGFDPRMFAVTADGTGAFFVPWGTVNATLDLPAGGVPPNVDLMPSWESDFTGLRCGHGDVGVGFTDLPCQEGHWTIGVEARRNEGEWHMVGAAEVDVVAGKTSNITIEVERWP